MQLGLPFLRASPASTCVVQLEGHPVPLVFVRTRRARHYILRVGPDGTVRVTVPWRGSRAEALRFVDERRAWIARERHQRAVAASVRRPWVDGTRVWFRGEAHLLRVCAVEDRGHVRVCLGDQSWMAAASSAPDVRRVVEAGLRETANVELPARLRALAAQHGFDIGAVTVRGQRSRWGSCSPSGRISLNWRLVQFPAAIVDYVLIHELVHLRHMNHSKRFWHEVESLCPGYRAARQWLRRTKDHGDTA